MNSSPLSPSKSTQPTKQMKALICSCFRGNTEVSGKRRTNAIIRLNFQWTEVQVNFFMKNLNMSECLYL